jgi:SNF2 family DNA or RNA helicase
MEKTGSSRDVGRRRRHVAKLQDLPAWRKRRELPLANETWPTALIVAPSTVVGNWEREFETWGYFEVGVYTGLPKVREQVLNNFKLGRLDISMYCLASDFVCCLTFRHPALVVTSFETARNDIEHLNNLAWTFVFVDEAHRMKNPSSILTRTFTTFQCRMRIALTGTAIQNTYAELWTLLDWTNPGEVGTYDEWRKVSMSTLGYVMSTNVADSWSKILSKRARVRSRQKKFKREPVYVRHIFFPYSRV